MCARLLNPRRCCFVRFVFGRASVREKVVGVCWFVRISVRVFPRCQGSGRQISSSSSGAASVRRSFRCRLRCGRPFRSINARASFPARVPLFAARCVSLQSHVTPPHHQATYLSPFVCFFARRIPPTSPSASVVSFVSRFQCYVLRITSSVNCCHARDYRNDSLLSRLLFRLSPIRRNSRTDKKSPIYHFNALLFLPIQGSFCLFSSLQLEEDCLFSFVFLQLLVAFQQFAAISV